MEVQNLSFVEDLTVANDFWHMKACIIRMWELTYKFELILIDERGRKIQGSVKKALMPGFQEHLKEDAVLVIRKFGVGEQKDKFKVIPLDHKINLFKCTSIQPVTSFVEINQGMGRARHTVDIMGRMAWCGDLDIFMSSTKESKRVNFELQDLDGQIMKCTVWGKYAEQVNKFVCSNTSPEIVICILQHARLKYFSGEVTVQNEMFGTRIFLNEDIDEANTLRRGLIVRDGGSSQTILSSQTVYPFHNEFVVKTEKKHVDEIREAMEEKHFIVLATIRMLEEEHGWFYIACRKHNRKVFSKEEYLEQAAEIPPHFLEAPMDSMWCLSCHDVATSLVPRFRVQFRVQDHTGSASFLMFDKEVAKIVGFSASDIRERQAKTSELEEFPRELDALINKFYAFKISVSLYNLDKECSVYTVSKFCDDPEIIAALQERGPFDEISQEQAEFTSVNLGECSQSVSESKDVVSFSADSLTPGPEEKPVAPFRGKREGADLGAGISAGQLSTSKKAKRKLEV